MPISVLVNGAFGKMGLMVAKALEEDDRFELVGQTNREYDLGKSINDSQPQVVIDFTNPESVFDNAMTIIDAGAHPVIGTTGLLEGQIQTLQKKAMDKKLGGIIAPNFSIGANLLIKYAKEIARHMKHLEIIEMHHDQKVDSPSGTAIRTAEQIAAVQKDLNKSEKNYHETIPGARGAVYQNIPIHAIRLPGLLAHQQVIFGGLGETLTLRHDAMDRLCFLPGIFYACQKVLELDRLVYGLEEII